MIVLPAVDLLDGKVVQLVGGRPGTEKVSLHNPREVALDWEKKGAPAIHVVDLNAAMGRGDNFNAITSIMAKVKVPLQVGGGIRTTEAAETLLNLGAARVVVGTRAITDPEWFADLVRSNYNKIMLALDIRDGKIQMRGWRESSEKKLKDILAATAGLPLAGVLHTNVNVEGKAAGIDLDEIRSFADMCPHPVTASGGVTTMEDLEALESIGIPSAVVGLALYVNIIQPEQVWGKK
ncbi:1-(5-phosphoribosyl)-5-[(5-phosphoribosylamino)methylideneamino]imidazole-4-carboxamide isomerase [Methanomassiliicoccus luminyensis]|jgi:phosphoribosylformimino-5-aminoimidazole carboxamide ribotide isomerase|uniref:1-(5-phosphoribosyl)-5-[(5- phosphoribosylamino)methylideneamino]imidazole-4- carboxamide isomerase n=1 Tax=Methanomassiliicoccus luminyensis TaxID=1080712 RepID=UPI0004745ED0|nr:1-(5-phosphoribosyl)-5-[(5-phosphoribosylamino)methylideneamino] imidazole-4-carboxamide isomerase [Methanomassiliicoccus luminyensis]